MMLLNWFRRPRGKWSLWVDPDVEEEKRTLQAELAQTVVTFERRRNGVHELATVTLNSMKKGKKR
ncbi:hypothetical protein [Rhizobium lentis]|uniref:Uncharacterized protein n=1 Tax=Rhizobium lentis TaxID=1138194 RepID=A0A7W8XD04_9HYPH|nr:hypothetical protein [Rhizobium lentis]MBB4574370.1 hypothetical protein [Rhizobium lentis]MBB5550296.1 hypothetical protein [Rhizobium lentis]MBB5560675.1 hypothetical protein [Rhizobium lentis]MBB5567260.1 hypothetical protein [Rhizobium lentis]